MLHKENPFNDKSCESQMFEDPFEREEDLMDYVVQNKISVSTIPLPENLAISRDLGSLSLESMKKNSSKDKSSQKWEKERRGSSKMYLPVFQNNSMNMVKKPAPIVEQENERNKKSIGGLNTHKKSRKRVSIVKSDLLKSEKLNIDKFEGFSRLAAHHRTGKTPRNIMNKNIEENDNLLQLDNSRGSNRKSFEVITEKNEDKQNRQPFQSLNNYIPNEDEDHSIKELKETSMHKNASLILPVEYKNYKYKILESPSNINFSIRTHKCKKNFTKAVEEVQRFEIREEEIRLILNSEVAIPDVRRSISVKTSLIEKTKLYLLQKLKKLENQYVEAKVSKCENFIALAFNSTELMLLKIDCSIPGKVFKEDELVLFDTAPKKQIIHIDWSYNSRYILTSHYDCSITIWDITTLKPETKVFHTSMITSVKFNPRHTLVFAATYEDRYLRVWDGHKSEIIESIRCHGDITCLEFSLSGKYMVMGFAEGSMEIYKYNKNFNMIFTSHVTKLPCSSEYEKGNKNNGQGMLSCINKPERTAVQVSEFKFINENEFFIILGSGEIILFAIDKLVVSRKYKPRKACVPETFDIYQNAILMGSSCLKTHLWNIENKYVPAFNPKYTKNKSMTNASVEELRVFKHNIKNNNLFCSYFLKDHVLEKWNKNKRNFKADMIILNISASREISIVVKRSINNQKNN